MTQHDMVANVEELVREIARPWWMSRQPLKCESVDRDENTVLKLRVAPRTWAR